MKLEWKMRRLTAGGVLLAALICALLLLGQRPLQAQAEAPQPVRTRPPLANPAANPAATPTPAPLNPRQIDIVGGGPAAKGEFPWQVVVYPGQYLCGGSLIDAGWVVTAAHCVRDSNGNTMAPTDVTVIAGDYNRTASDGTEQQRSVSQVIVHPNYDANTSDNDIALLRLSSPVDLSRSAVGTIPLVSSPANDSLVAPGTLTTVSGWGASSEGGSTPAVLNKVQVPIVSNTVCSNAYGGGITANMICAGYAAGGKDSCQGDSGGPLVVPDGSGWRLAGVVSVGVGCARPDYYGIYTRVSQYVAWLAGYIGSAPTPTAVPTAVPTAAPSATPQPTAQPTAQPTPVADVLQNGGFEAGATSTWTQSSSNGYDLILSSADLQGLVPHSGNWAAWLGGENNEDSVLSQDVALNGSQATLTFYYQIDSADTCGHDTAEVTAAAVGAAGPQATALASFDLCASKAISTWQSKTVDLGAFVGQTIHLEFKVHTNATAASSLFLDDVSIAVQSGGATATPAAALWVPFAANKVIP